MSQAMLAEPLAADIGEGATIAHKPRRFHVRLNPALPILGLLVIVASSFLGRLDPVSPLAVDLAHRLLPPLSAGHPLGTDALGRDILARLLGGSRISVIVAVSSVAISAVVGMTLGIYAAQKGGQVDSIIMRFTEITQGIPLLIVAILLAAVYGPTLQNVVIILGIFQWPQFARISRAEALSIKEKQFVLASRVNGASTWLIIRRHFVPNLASSMYILASILAAGAVLAEAGLSFFGAGVPPPTPSWGNMVNDGREYIVTAWWITLFPGMAISMMVLCLNVLGDYLRDILDPQLRTG